MTENSTVASTGDLCRVLSLDGGGSKGFYTIGVLREIEALLAGPLCDRFDLIFGTSTGSIIAALLALGYRVDEIHKLYKEHVPRIVSPWFPSQRSKALKTAAEFIFGDKKFTDAKTGIGIVATNWQDEKPMIFKASVSQAHGRHGSFVPGFGCTIAEAVRASCAAYPVFNRVVLKTEKSDWTELLDGGYCANDPTLYAIADAVLALKKNYSQLRVVSIGTGNHPEPGAGFSPFRNLMRIYRKFTGMLLFEKTLKINTHSLEQLRTILFKDVRTIRINSTFNKPEMATDLLESDPRKLDMLFRQGGESYAEHEAQLREFFL